MRLLTTFMMLCGCVVLYSLWMQYKAGCKFEPTTTHLTLPKQRMALITGSSSGIGLATAIRLAELGVNVIITCRTQSRCEAAQLLILQRAKAGHQNVTVSIELLDLASLKNVQQMAQRVIQRYAKIHYLINNAGVLETSLKFTQEKHEMHFGVNHLGHFLLTQLLLPHMKQSGEQIRVIIVSSEAHHFFGDRLNFSDPGGSQLQPYNCLYAYGQSKLANVLHARELARRENVHINPQRGDQPQVLVASIHPGAVATELGRSLPMWLYVIMNLFGPYTWMKTPMEGTHTTLHCLFHSSLQNNNGAYFKECEPIVTTLNAQSNDDARDLWRLSEEAVSSFLLDE